MFVEENNHRMACHLVSYHVTQSPLIDGEGRKDMRRRHMEVFLAWTLGHRPLNCIRKVIYTIRGPRKDTINNLNSYLIDLGSALL